MKNILYFSLFLILISCGNNSTEVNVELGHNLESETLPSCNCDSLSFDDNDQLLNEGKVFTGTCYLNFPSSEQKYIEKQILDGVVHGKITYFDKSGNILFDESYNDGELLASAESMVHCNCAELNIKESSDNLKKNYLNESLFTGACEDYFPNSDQIYLEANYKDGLLHGFTIHYNKDGSVLIMQSYDNGMLIEDIIPQ